MRKRFLQPRIILATLLAVTALGLVLYPSVSNWWNDRIQSEAISKLGEAIAVGPEEHLEEVRMNAHEYNKKLSASGDNSDYFNQLNYTSSDGLMGRIKIPVIDVDIPIFHTSSDEVLRKGAGHMEETTLPVGGESTHAAITAHRGLAESKLFTELDKVGIGDRFTLEVAGEVLTYQVFETRIVKPTETEWLVVQPGRDLVTLITCDPLGINTERMLVTGERVTPTPIQDVEEAGSPKTLPSPPGWVWFAGLGIGVIGFSAWWFSRPLSNKKDRKEEVQEDAGSFEEVA